MDTRKEFHSLLCSLRSLLLCQSHQRKKVWIAERSLYQKWRDEPSSTPPPLPKKRAQATPPPPPLKSTPSKREKPPLLPLPKGTRERLPIKEQTFPSLLPFKNRIQKTLPRFHWREELLADEEALRKQSAWREKPFTSSLLLHFSGKSPPILTLMEDLLAALNEKVAATAPLTPAMVKVLGGWNTLAQGKAQLIIATEELLAPLPLFVIDYPMQYVEEPTRKRALWKELLQAYQEATQKDE